jgi:hypothetical protein
MKKFSIVLASVLALSALGGCKKKGGDCAATINGMMDRMSADAMKDDKAKMTPEMKKMADEMMKKMSEPMIKACSDDKWSAEALKCMDDAKAEDDGKKCEKMLTPEQSKHMEKVMSEAMGMGDKPSMGGDKPAMGDKPAEPAAPAGSAAAPAAGGASGLPAECDDYKAAIDKLSTCDAMPKEARDAMKQAFDQASAGWAQLPAEAKASLATACKAGADAVKQSAAACK